MADFFSEWDKAYRSFKGHFDTPVARRKDNSEFANDARQRLRRINELIEKVRADIQDAERSESERMADIANEAMIESHFQ